MKSSRDKIYDETPLDYKPKFLGEEMNKKLKPLRKILVNLIAYQKIPCQCSCADGLESVSLDRAEQQIKALMDEEKLAKFIDNAEQQRKGGIA